MPASDSQYENLREFINPSIAHLSDAELETVFESHGMRAQDMEGFFDNFGKIASSIGQVALKAAPAILPIAGQVVGTAFGGPIGASIGGSLGSLAGQAIGSATGQKPAPAGGGGGAGGGIAGLVGGALGSLTGGSPAAGQLLQAVTKPETLQALTSMAMGALGKPSIPVGGTSAPPSAFVNMLKMLTQKAEAEYAENMARYETARGVAPEYMLDYAGEPKADPAVAANRAAVLYTLLQSMPTQSEQESESEAEAAEQEAEAVEAEYDALDMELMELYESEEA